MSIQRNIQFLPSFRHSYICQFRSFPRICIHPPLIEDVLIILSCVLRSTKTYTIMKLVTTTAVLALATSIVALPSDELQKRATCTIFGFRYPCTSSAGAPATATIQARSTSPSASATPISEPSRSSTGGKSAYTGGSTASDIDNNTGCTALTVIHARGTVQEGNIGIVAAPPMFKQLLSDLGASSLTLQGLNYPAVAPT